MYSRVFGRRLRTQVCGDDTTRARHALRGVSGFQKQPDVDKPV